MNAEQSAKDKPNPPPEIYEVTLRAEYRGKTFNPTLPVVAGSFDEAAKKATQAVTSLGLDVTSVHFVESQRPPDRKRVGFVVPGNQKKELR